MIRNVTAGRTNITPAVAAEWLEKYEYPFQRDISDVTVRQLSIAMSQEQFTGNTIKIAFIGGVGYCANGQHTLLAIIDSEKTQNLTVENFEVDTDDDVAHIYYTTDRNRKRTIDDMLRTKRMRERTGFKRAELNSLGSAVRLVEAGFDRHKAQLITYDDLYEMMLTWKPYADEYFQTVERCPLTKYRMIRKPVMAMGIATFRYAPERVRDFWHGVGFNDNVPDGDARRTLHYFIMNAHVMNGKMENIICRAIARGWNYYHQGKQFSKVVTTSLNEPVKIYGTELSA